MSVATGIGSMPGEDAEDYAQAVRVVFDEVPDLPFLPELPGRGAQAHMLGRTLALVSDLAADLQPAGWRLTDAPGVDQRRARSLVAQDLDTLEELAEGYTGRLKVQVTGPWTLAATVERPRGDRVLADHGARRELAQALAEGLRAHVAEVQRRLPGTEIVVQVDEPALPAVLAGGIPTASGFSRHRSVDLPIASPALEWVLEAVTSAGATSVVHCCAADVPVSLLLGAGAQGISVDLGVLTASSYDDLAGALDQGVAVFLGVVPAQAPVAPVGERALTAQVERFLGMVGLDPADLGDLLVVTPACGLAGAGREWAREALSLARRVAGNLDG